MSTHLHRRSGGTYYFRRAIPQGLRGLLGGRREWFCSLGTKDRNEAKRLLPRYTLASNDMLAWAELGADPAKCPKFPSNEGQERQECLSAPLGAKQPKTCCRPLLALFEGYSNEQRIKPGTAAEWRSIICKLIAFIGHDDAARLQANDIDRWRDHLLAESVESIPVREPRTVRTKYLTAIHATLSWAVEKRLLQKNVAKGIVVRVPRKPVLRQRDLTDQEVRTILLGSLDRPTANLRSELARARRWIPWLCAYTGARVNELSQLRCEDVVVQGGSTVIRITPEAGTVKGASARIVPLHSHIIEQGFLRMVEAQGFGPLFYDASRMRRPGAANRYIKKVGEHLRDWVRDELGIVDPGVQPNHGWRHRFKSVMIDHAVPERVADAIQGHAPRSVGQTYGMVSVATMREAIERMPRIQVGE